MSWLTKFFKFREKSDGDVVKPFLEHLEDLRWTLIKCMVTGVLSMFISFFWVDSLMHMLQKPLAAIDPALPGKLITTGITDSLVISIELAFFGGLVLSLPFLIYFLASFILPALTRQEKRFLFPGIFGSFALFVTGVLVAYYYILPQTLKFFHGYAAKLGVQTLWTWRDYLSFCTWLTIGFGLLCQLPVAVVVLSVIGLIDFRFLSATRPYAVTLILILAAIIAPTPDPFTFLSLGAPVLLLYELCIWIVWGLERRRKNQALEKGEG